MRTVIRHLRCLALAVIACIAIAAGALSASVTIATLTPAHAQVSAEFQSALEPYGSWQPHPRFGEVWVPTICRPGGVPTRTDDGSTPKSGAGTGSPTRKRPTGVGWPSTMAAGRMIGGLAGSGFPATNGARPGSIGAAATTMSAGRRCRPMNSYTNMTTIRPTGFSCRRAIWSRHASAPTSCRHSVRLWFSDGRSSSIVRFGSSIAIIADASPSIRVLLLELSPPRRVGRYRPSMSNPAS